MNTLIHHIGAVRVVKVEAEKRQEPEILGEPSLEHLNRYVLIWLIGCVFTGLVLGITLTDGGDDKMLRQSRSQRPPAGRMVQRPVRSLKGTRRKNAA